MREWKAKILIVDDEPQIRKFLRVALEAHGYDVCEANTGRSGLDLVRQDAPDLIILDLGLPDRDGQEILLQIREIFAKPILVLSVRDDEDNIVRALEGRASDYVRKPFNLAELLARVRNLLASANPAIPVTQSVLEFQHLRIDLAARRVFHGTQEVNLSGTEYELLKLLATNAGKILTHRQLLTAIWGPHGEKHHEYLRVYVSHLRHKVEIEPSFPRLLINEPGVGYRFGG
jgi:two-component system KDP operon response regulator KdpE